MEAKPIHFMELVEVLTKHGFESLADLGKFPPNPLKWTRQNWQFALDIIGISESKTPKEVIKEYTKPGEILVAFNQSLRKFGLIIELQQISKLSDAKLAKQLNREAWDTEWVDTGK